MIPRPLKIGIGGPVGSGKTALVERLCRALRDELSVGVITNDIYTREDAEFLLRAGIAGHPLPGRKSHTTEHCEHERARAKLHPHRILP